MTDENSCGEQMTLFDAIGKKALGDSSPTPFIDYTQTNRNGQRIHSCMQTIKPFSEKQPIVSIGGMQIKIPRREFDRLSAWFLRRFNEGHSFKESMLEIIELCDTQL